MNEDENLPARRGRHFGRMVLIGFFTVAPLWVTWLVFEFLQGILAAAGTPLLLGALYGIGLLASLVLGRKLITHMEALLARLPLVQTIYGGTKRFLASLRKPPHDEATGRELAAVYVPTSPNPTSCYSEIVPLSDVVQTDWTMEEAMSFVMTGGANAQDKVRYHAPEQKVGAGGAAP